MSGARNFCCCSYSLVNCVCLVLMPHIDLPCASLLIVVVVVVWLTAQFAADGRVGSRTQFLCDVRFSIVNTDCLVDAVITQRVSISKLSGNRQRRLHDISTD